MFLRAVKQEIVRTFKNQGYKKTHTEVTKTVEPMIRIDIEMDKLRQEYIKMYDLPKGTGIFFSNNGDTGQIKKLLKKFLEIKDLGWNQDRF